MKAKWKTQYWLLPDGFWGEQAQIWHGQNCLYCINQVFSCLVLWNFKNLKWRVYMVNFCSLCLSSELPLRLLPAVCSPRLHVTSFWTKLCLIFPVTTVWLFPEKCIGVCAWDWFSLLNINQIAMWACDVEVWIEEKVMIITVSSYQLSSTK